MRTAAILVASLLIVACSGSDSSDASETSDGSAATNDDTTEATSDDTTDDSTDDSGDDTTDDSGDDTTESTDADADGNSTTSTSATSESGITESTTDEQTSSTVDGSSATVAPSEPGASTTVAPASDTPTTTVGSIDTTDAPTTTAPAARNVPDAAAALSAFQAAVAGYSADDDDFIDLDECPLDPNGGLVDAIVAGAAEQGLLPATSGESESGIFDLGDGYGPTVSCDSFAVEEPVSVGLFALAAPGDLNAYATLFGNPDAVEGVEILVEPKAPLGDGVIHHVCAFDEIEPDFSFCEVDWVTDEVLIGVYVAGPISAEVDRAALEASFVSQLEAIVDAFAS